MLSETSAILQCVGPDRRPLVSVLEPVESEENSSMLPPSQPLTSPPTSEGKEEVNPLASFMSLSPSSTLLSSLRLPLAPAGLPNGLLSVMNSSQTHSSPSTPTNASQLQGTTIGPCPEHVTGRQPGVECAKCDFILNSARLGEDFLNNPAKALKCPKCNWHYKYQETLEVHMKDKHPESTSHCIYCITGQQHPRLARGETYTCGYKPYRCEVCNYSTTTKGNLSIHMQSDKHINNMQELQNGGVVTASDGTKITQNILSKMPRSNQRLSSPHPVQQQNMWRCDICNFETSQPRNLRVHMTSDKHVQSVTAIQQNMKQLQGIQLLQNLTNTERNGVLPAMPALQPTNEMMMMMELANQASQAHHNQNIFLQLLARQNPPEVAESGEQSGEGSGTQSDPNPVKLFNCCICREFSTDTLEGLSSHISLDRSQEGEGEVQILLGGTHICKLCSYKTNLKANFQLHCKTDKHLARLSLYNHIREGGPSNEWKLSMLTGTNPTQLRCQACDFNTNSMHKLQAHTKTQSHEVSVILFSHLCQAEAHAPQGVSLSYSCTLCKFTARGKAALLNHARTLLHLRAEQLCEARRVEAGGEQPGIADIFVVTEYSDTEQAESSETGE